MKSQLFDKWLASTGQIELYTHLPVMRQLVEQLQQWEFRVCGVFLVDSQFMVESFKVTANIPPVLLSVCLIPLWVRAHLISLSPQYSNESQNEVTSETSSLFLWLQFISGVMAALSAMVSLEIPQVNIMTKMDLLSPKAKKEIEK